MNDIQPTLVQAIAAAKDFRDKVAILWDFMKDQPQVATPLVHRYQEGVYIREIFMPAGSIVLGKIHKHQHWNMILKGQGVYVTKEGKFIYKAPHMFISGPGIQKIVFNMTDTVWCTTHHNPTNSQDLKELEADIVIHSYEALDEFLGIQEVLS